jgi:hypothetical protein
MFFLGLEAKFAYPQPFDFHRTLVVACPSIRKANAHAQVWQE